MRAKAYPRYKDSGVEWLGEVPEHWAVKRLRHVGEAIIGLTYSPTDVVNEGDGTLVLRSSNIQNGKLAFGDNVYVSAEIPPQLRTRANDILICTRNGSQALVGKTAWVSERDAGLSFGAFTAVFRSESNTYLFHVFNSALFSFQAGLYQTSTIFQLTNGTINALQIPLPTYDEQQAIASFLDRETSRIDRLVGRKRELIERLKEKRTALIARTVTRGLPPAAAKAAGLPVSAPLKPSGVDWLGEIPKHWDVVPLGYLVRISGGSTPDKSNAAYWDGSIPWVSPKDMKVAQIADAEDHISSEALDNSTLRLLPVDSVLIVVRGMILAHSFPVALTTAPVTINQDMKAVACGNRLLPRFLSWSFTGFAKTFVSFADESAHGTRKLETPTLTRFPFLLPPLSEQVAIASYLDAESVS